MEDNSFTKALFDAFNELEELKAQEKKIFVRKAQLKKSVDALYPLVFPESQTEISALTLADAIRLVFKSAARPLSAVEVRSKLDDIGFDLEQFENALASIHTAMSRMIDSEELVKVPDEGKKKAFERGPALKDVPDPSSTPDDEALKAALEELQRSFEQSPKDVVEGEFKERAEEDL